MNHLILPLLLAFIVSGCRETLQLVDQKGSTLLKGSPAEISTIQEGIWKVGKSRQKLISKSISFYINTPIMKEEDALDLAKKYGINSWLFRVRRLGKSQDEIGYFYVQFITDRGRPEFAPVNKTMVEICYAASYASERFRNFNCPAFNHRKKLLRFRMEPNGVTHFSAQTFPKHPLNSQSELSFVNPAKLNGGNSLVGVYDIDVVLYNNKTKEYFGQFSPVKNRLIIDNEEEIDLPECLGVHQENEAPNLSKPNFHFGH